MSSFTGESQRKVHEHIINILNAFFIFLHVIVCQYLSLLA